MHIVQDSEQVTLKITMSILILFLLQVSWAVLLPDARSANLVQKYNSYTGNILTSEEYAEHKKKNSTFWCVNEIEPCNSFEGRRIDGSCNNLRNPSRGAGHTPGYKVLPTVFDKDNNPRKSKNGEELPISRKVRTTLLLEGREPDFHFTHLVTYFSVFMSADILSFHDTINYMFTTNCCDKKNKKKSSVCIKQAIPEDDPVHRFSNERCLNLTHPWTFQSKGCLRNNTHPERVVSANSFFDLSQIYGATEEELKRLRRLYKGGLLKFEIEEGRMWPPSAKKIPNVCLSNQGPGETRCHDIGEDSLNGILGTNLFTIWMWRLHNFIARELSRINPCWDDEKLFYTAKDINIAITNQIFFYELNSVLLGLNNLYEEGVLSRNLGFRDVYDEAVMPQISMEYGFVLRWMHTIQEGVAKMYDSEGQYLDSVKIVDLTLRTGYLADQDHIDHMTQGAFRQAAGKVDNAIDPDIAETGLGPLQRLADIATSDLAKNRHIGLAPYVNYRQFCFGDIITSFEELTQAIEPEKIELLKEIYKDVEDVDLLAGIWVERPISGARVPATFYCLVVDQLKRTIVSDRHWYERPNRPNAFTIDQLIEIRKATIARVMCDVGDKVTKIQPRAFLIPGFGNEIRSCKEISNVDLNAWKDNCDIISNINK